MKRVLITGAGRGLGLALVKQYVKSGDHVFAGCRSLGSSKELQQLHSEYFLSLTILAMDVTDDRSVANCTAEIRRQVDGLDILINSAGINARSSDLRNPMIMKTPQSVGAPGDIDHLDLDSLRLMLAVNAIGPLLVTQQCLPLLRNGVEARVVNISSDRGSLSLKRKGGNYGYCGSKAALNMLTRALAFDVAKDGIVTIMMHPGWVRTDLGGPKATLSPDESAAGITRVIDHLSVTDVGRFLTWQGGELPW